MKKDDIIDISLQLFLEKGYEKTTITDIMKKSKLSKGGMYHYFCSKEDIFNAAVKKALAEEQSLFENAVNKCSSLEEKFVLLFMNTSSSDYFKRFSFFVQKERDSLIFYRLRELFREHGTKKLKNFLVEGVEANLFNFDVRFIDKVSKTVYNCGEDIAFRVMTVSDKNSFFQKELIAFSYITERLLSSSKEFNEKFREILLEKFQ